MPHYSSLPFTLKRSREVLSAVELATAVAEPAAAHGLDHSLARDESGGARDRGQQIEESTPRSREPPRGADDHS